jgi:hypothetical protein
VLALAAPGRKSRQSFGGGHKGYRSSNTTVELDSNLGVGICMNNLAKGATRGPLFRHQSRFVSQARVVLEAAVGSIQKGLMRVGLHTKQGFEGVYVSCN